MTTTKKNKLWGFDLEYPDLWCFTLGHINFPVVWYVVHQNAYSGMMQNEAPLVTEERVSFNFQSVEKNTTHPKFLKEWKNRLFGMAFLIANIYNKLLKNNK